MLEESSLRNPSIVDNYGKEAVLLAALYLHKLLLAYPMLSTQQPCSDELAHFAQMGSTMLVDRTSAEQILWHTPILYL